VTRLAAVVAGDDATSTLATGRSGGTLGGLLLELCDAGVEDVRGASGRDFEQERLLELGREERRGVKGEDLVGVVADHVAAGFGEGARQGFVAERAASIGVVDELSDVRQATDDFRTLGRGERSLAGVDGRILEDGERTLGVSAMADDSGVVLDEIRVEVGGAGRKIVRTAEDSLMDDGKVVVIIIIIAVVVVVAASIRKLLTKTTDVVIRSLQLTAKLADFLLKIIINIRAVVAAVGDVAKLLDFG
jgi:hypothetical protein